MIVINTFHRSPLQLSILPDKLKAFYGKTSALVLAVITRWGTQAHAIKSIYRNKDTLKSYILNDLIQHEHEVTRLLSSHDFCNNVEELHDLILPNYVVLVQSESSNVHLRLVVSRRLTIHGHLECIVDRKASLQEIPG
ncbi:hypothetical protein HOY82DRAFT_601293 [Tuber indicum]|nr:hypothetical protein HOY82DRAFT_601293 [Tuber indicum]